MKSPDKNPGIIWDWRIPAANQQKSDSSRRRFLVIQCIIMVIIAILLFFIFHKPIFATVVCGLAVFILFTGLFSPSLLIKINAFGRGLGHVIGTGLTWLLLVPFFYMVFLFGRIILKILNKDPMQRNWEKDRDSYWIDRKDRHDPDYYKRQY